MADEIDIANDELEKQYGKAQRFFREQVENIPEGVEGECERCGEHSLRLVRGACARCRDRLRLG